VAGRSRRPAGAGRFEPRQPLTPDLPGELEAAVLPAHDLADGMVYEALAFAELDLSGGAATGAEFDQCRLHDVNFGRAKLRRCRITDTEIDRCDLANLRAIDCSLSRVSVRAARMTGLSWLDGQFRDVTFDQCRMDLASFRSTACDQVVFSGCRLEQADFGEADLRGARFERCDLTGAQFDQARMSGARFTGCQLAEITGVTSFRGATISSEDLFALTYLLAGALGITIEQ
jgi:Pentapeptide repeats (8 copies)/Pentapeptide repeats (9 copies)